MMRWGDGNYSEWVGPYASGDIVSLNYCWENKGEYEIKVKAKDIHGKKSDWSEPLVISMPRNKIFFHIGLFFEKHPNFVLSIFHE